MDTKFTANMEKELDDVEEGSKAWKQLLREFYDPFQQNLQKAEADLEGVRLKVPDEVSEEVCDLCGKQMVIKSGRFGRFLACPGFPECSFTKPLVVVMPGRCPQCGGRLMKRSGFSQRTNKQYFYYCCEYLNSKDESKKCEFRTWDVPVADDCPQCGQTMFKKSGKGFKRPYCINEQCPNFTPEEKRGGYKKPEQAPAEGGAAGEEKPKKAAARKTAAKKTAAKKPAAKAPAKKTAAKKTTTKKSAADEADNA